MDVLRGCYKSRFRFFTDDPGETDVEWYFTKSRSTVPATIFASSLYDGDEPHGAVDAQGELIYRDQYRWWRFTKGEDKWMAPGVIHCGTDAEWAGAMAVPPPEPIPVDPDGVPLCCWPTHHQAQDADGAAALEVAAEAARRRRMRRAAELMLKAQIILLLRALYRAIFPQVPLAMQTEGARYLSRATPGQAGVTLSMTAVITHSNVTARTHTLALIPTGQHSLGRVQAGADLASLLTAATRDARRDLKPHDDLTLISLAVRQVYRDLKPHDDLRLLLTGLSDFHKRSVAGTDFAKLLTLASTLTKKHDVSSAYAERMTLSGSARGKHTYATAASLRVNPSSAAYLGTNKCTNAAHAHKTYTLSVGTVTNGTCSDCSNAAGTWTLTWQSLCFWQGPAYTLCGFSTIRWAMQINATTTTVTTTAGGSVTYTYSGAWDGNSPITLTRGTNPAGCSFPSTVTITPV